MPRIFDSILTLLCHYRKLKPETNMYFFPYKTRPYDDNKHHIIMCYYRRQIHIIDTIILLLIALHKIKMANKKQ